MNIRPQLLAANSAIGQTLDLRAILGRHTAVGVEPGPDTLTTCKAQGGGKRCLPPDDVGSTTQRVLV